MDHQKAVRQQRQRRRLRVRKRLTGNACRPRLTVSRSHRHISAQVIDDLAGKTLVAASSGDQELAHKIKYGGNKDSASLVGKMLAERAEKMGIKQVCFDRGDSKYHGRVASLADAARAGGLEF